MVVEHIFRGEGRDEFEFAGFCNANLIAPDKRALTLGVEVLEASMAVPFWQGKWGDHLDPRPEEAQHARFFSNSGLEHIFSTSNVKKTFF